MAEEQSIIEIKVVICIFLLITYLLVEFLEVYEHSDSIAAVQPIFATTEYPLPNHGNDRGTQYERTMGTAISLGTTSYRPELLDWLPKIDYQPYPAPDLTYLYQSIGTVFPHRK